MYLMNERYTRNVFDYTFRFQRGYSHNGRLRRGSQRMVLVRELHQSFLYRTIARTRRFRDLPLRVISSITSAEKVVPKFHT